ncbi:hypothetical protein B0H19DRAFT_294660 [Mycena capillaripes]|nr:hypothetical protein B0H19DRAFT_294660 [Mycena capillaripes]
MSSMSSNTSPIYRYAILVAVVFFAAVFAKVFLSSRVDRQRRLRARERERALGGGELDVTVLERMKPPLFDAYLGAAPRITEAEAEADRWNEIMPLHVSNINTESSPVVVKGGQGADMFKLLRVSVVVRMPVPSFSAPDPLREGEEEPQLPYVELGIAEVSVLEPEGAQKSVP